MIYFIRDTILQLQWLTMSCDWLTYSDGTKNWRPTWGHKKPPLFVSRSQRRLVVSYGGTTI